MGCCDALVAMTNERDDLSTKVAELEKENAQLHALLDAAFEAHPNLDLDIDYTRKEIK